MSRYSVDFSRSDEKDSRMGYTLVDDIYFDTLNLVTEELHRRDIAYAIVGGGANQIWLAHAIAGRRSINRSEESLDPILRPTKDIDIISYDVDKFTEFMMQLSYLVDPASGIKVEPGPNIVVVKRGGDRITLQYASPSSSPGEPEDVYRYRVDSAEEVMLKKGENTIYPLVARPEHVLALKLTQPSNREKHMKDVYDMLYNFHRKGINFDDEEVRSLLKRLGKESEIDSIARIRQSFR